MYRNFKVLGLGLLAHVTPSIFFSRILKRETLVYNSYFFRTAVSRKLFDIRFSYKHCHFSRVCLLVKMASKTVTGSIPKNTPPDSSDNNWYGYFLTFALGIGHFRPLSTDLESQTVHPHQEVLRIPPPPHAPPPEKKSKVLYGLRGGRKSTRSIMSSTRKPM